MEEYLVSGIEPSAIEWLISTSNSQLPDSVGVTTYLSFVRFSHSVFALPFALTGALLAWREQPFAWSQVAWIVVHGQRESAAMGFNRLVDARMDALNPRMAMRELPRGLLSKPEATVFVIVAAVVFVFAASRLSPLCLALAPVALMMMFRACIAGQAVHDIHADVSRPRACRRAGRRVDSGGWSRRRRTMAAWPGHRLVGRRVRHPLRLPGRRLRSPPWSAIDPGDLWRDQRDSHLAPDARRHCRRDGVAVVGGQSSPLYVAGVAIVAALLA